MADSGFRLGIDFGTSNTVAVLRWPDGRTKSLLFDGNPLLPSAVYVAPEGSILTGRDAVHSARLQPHRFEPYPKRRLEEGTVWLGERDVPVVDLIATVLRRVATEAQRVAGAVPSAVTVTHPAAWAPQRRDTLSRATVAAGLPAPLLAPEPVAAASYFVGTVGARVPVGGFAVVYDFGAGTFDASVVRRNAGGGFEVLANEGLSDAGGLDVDAAIVTHLGKVLAARDTGEWRRLSTPDSEQDRRAAWQLWEDARLAKEMLSRAASTYVHVPLYDESVPVSREELEQLARPILDRTVTATQLAVSSSGLTDRQVAALFLVGGSSRIPLAATLLHRAFGMAPTAIEQPELVVAEGALHLAPPTGRASVGATNGLPVGGSPAPVSSAPVSGVPSSGVPISGSPVSSGSVSGGPVSGGTVSGGTVSGGSVSGGSVSGGPASPGPSFTTPSSTPSGPFATPPPVAPAARGPAGPVSPQAPYQPPPAPHQVPQQQVPQHQVPQHQVPQQQVPPPYGQQTQPPYGQQTQPPYGQQPPPPHAPVTSPMPPQPQVTVAQPFQPIPVSATPVSPTGGMIPAPRSGGPTMMQPSYGQPPPPASGGRRTGALIGIGAGVLAAILAMVGIVYAANNGGDTPGPGESSAAAAEAGASPACGYKIAMLGVLTGDNAGDGTMVRDSAKLAVAQYNKRHSGCTVELAEYDTGQNEDTSRSAARQLAADPKILGVVGPIYRSEVLGALPVLESESDPVPVITPAATDNEFSDKGWTVFHRVLGTDRDQATAGARYLQKTLNAKKTYVVADGTAFGTSGSAAARQELNDGTFHGIVYIDRDGKDFAAAVKQVVDSGADSVYFAGFYDDGAIFVKQLRAAKPSIIIMSGDKIFTDIFVDGAGKSAAEGVYLTCPCMPANSSADSYINAFKDEYDDDPGYYGPEAFDATNILLSGIEKGKSTRSAMNAYVDAYEGQGLTRKIKFTQTGDLDPKGGNLQIWLFRVSGGTIIKQAVIPEE